MAKLFEWIKSAPRRLLDPDRQQRLDSAAADLERRLAEQRSQFDLTHIASILSIYDDDLPEVLRLTYERFVSRAWKDEALTSKERDALRWVAKQLTLDDKTARGVECRVVKAVIERWFAEAIADRKLDPSELLRLDKIAASLGTDPKALVRAFLADECEGVLRNMFASLVNDGRLAEEEWMRLLAAAEALGFDDREVATLVAPQAERLIEHTLADAKSDGRMNASERETINWLLGHLQIRPEAKAYVLSEIHRLEMLTAVAEGNLPVISGSQLALRAGEIAHFQSPAVYRRVRNLRNGPVVDDHRGQFLVTDYRCLFSSPTHSHEINLRRIIELFPIQKGFELRSSGKGGGTYLIFNDSELALGILQAAVNKANQTLVCKPDLNLNRHIPRDVRQRVWQRYGGKCVECGADQYLEFDHIVPVAKGGSNSDNNVQLLCRGCNSTKSAHI